MNKKTEAASLHDSLRDLIGQAISDEIAAGAEQPDWCDSREIDRLADAVMAVLPTTEASAPQVTPKHIEEIKDILLWPVTEDDARVARDMLQSLHFDLSMQEAAPQQHAQAALSDEKIATMWLAAQDQAVSGRPAPIHFARAILAASQQPAAAPAIDRAAIHHKVLAADMDGPDVVDPTVCTVPPPGWACTRAPGHDGPCAAIPAAAPAVQVQSSEKRNDVEQLAFDLISNRGAFPHICDYVPLEEVYAFTNAIASQASKGAGAQEVVEALSNLLGAAGPEKRKVAADAARKALADYRAAPSPALAQPSVEDKALFWLDCLSKCAKLLELSEDTPIPSGVVAAVEKLVAAQAQPVASQRPSDDDLWDQTLRERDYNAEIADKLSLHEMLMTWPRERLVKELAGQAKENAALRERVARMECEVFWLKVPAADLLPSAATVLLRELTHCAGGMVNGNRLSRRAIEALAEETQP